MTYRVNEQATCSEPIALGHQAGAALMASDGQVSLFARLGDGCYLDAAGEIVWASHGGALSHPRAAILVEPLPAGWSRGRILLPRLCVPIPELPRRIYGGRSALEARARWLLRAFGEGTSVLQGMPALLGALGNGDISLAARLAGAVMGRGAGLTPSADDAICGILFAVQLLSLADRGSAEPARALCKALAREAAGRTTRISAVLIADAAAGWGFFALHDLCEALAVGDETAMSATMPRVLAIGHSSGRELVLGLLRGLAGLPACQSMPNC